MSAATAAADAPERRTVPWGDYVLRVLASLLLFGSGFSLLAGSPFALRMRDDVPPIVPGMEGVIGLALILSAVLAFLPLLFGRRFLGAFLVSSFALCGIGGYWWTLIPWDELLTESDFPAPYPPDWWRYAQVASPLVAALLYIVASRASRMRAEYRNRGADPAEVSNAAAASFLAGMGVLVATLALSGALWALLSSGLVLSPPSWVPRGIPAVVVASALLVVAWGLSSPRVMRGAQDGLRRPWRAAAGRAARARSRARRSPS